MIDGIRGRNFISLGGYGRSIEEEWREEYVLRRKW